VITVDTLKDMLLDLKQKTSKDIHDELMPFLLPIKDMEKELFGAPLSTVPFGDGDTYKLLKFLSLHIPMMEGCCKYAYIAPGKGRNPDTMEEKKIFLLFIVERHDILHVGTWDYQDEEYVQGPELISPDAVAGDLLLALKLFAFQLECSMNGIHKPKEYEQASKVVQDTLDTILSRHGGD
jgi:hypothetical protein